MGWKGAVRSINAAGNRARREAEKAERATNRALSQIVRNAEQVLSKTKSYEQRLTRDPIKTLSLTYSHTNGFEGESFPINTDIFSGSISLLPSPDDNDSGRNFYPESYDTISSYVKPLSVLLTRWGTVVAIEVGNSDPEFLMKTNWVKKSDPEASSILLLDKHSGRYYYPVASNLKGDVIPGHPKVGLVAFDRFKRPVKSFQLHVTNVPLQKGRGGKHTFQFEYKSQNLEGDIQNVLNKPSLYSEVDEIMCQKVDELQQSVTKTQSGCLFVVAAGVGGILSGVFLMC